MSNAELIMEQRLIDANRMKEHVAFQQDILVNMGMEEIGNILVKMIFDEINIQPTVDAVQVVRCKECKHRFVDGENVRFNVCEMNHNKVQSDDWFCADGERRSDGK